EPVVEHKGPGTSGSDANAKAPWCLLALDCGSCKIGDAVAGLRDRQALDRFLAEFFSHWEPPCPHGVRTISSPECQGMCAQCHVVSMKILDKINVSVRTRTINNL